MCWDCVFRSITFLWHPLGEPKLKLMNTQSFEKDFTSSILYSQNNGAKEPKYKNANISGTNNFWPKLFYMGCLIPKGIKLCEWEPILRGSVSKAGCWKRMTLVWRLRLKSGYFIYHCHSHLFSAFGKQWISLQKQAQNFHVAWFLLNNIYKLHSYFIITFYYSHKHWFLITINDIQVVNSQETKILNHLRCAATNRTAVQ